MSTKNLNHIVLIMGIIVLMLALPACNGSDEEDNPQYTIGLVTNNPNGLKNVQGFRDGMAELGYIEGENVTYIFADGPVTGAALEAALQDMVEKKVDLIFTAGTPTGVAAHQATAETNIPVVFGVIADPIAAGVMDDITTPGGNMTGVMLSENQGRRLELLLEIVPGARRIFVPYNPEDAAPVSALAQMQERASDLGIDIITAEAHNDDEVTPLLNNMPEDIDAIFLLPDSVVNARLVDIVALAIDRGLPVSGPSNAQVEDGALTAYGIIHHEVGVQVAQIADKILKGGDPGTLPVQTAEFYLAINLETADAIGLEIPYSTLQQAKIIIRANGEE